MPLSPGGEPGDVISAGPEDGILGVGIRTGGKDSKVCLRLADHQAEIDLVSAAHVGREAAEGKHKLQDTVTEGNFIQRFRLFAKWFLAALPIGAVDLSDGFRFWEGDLDEAIDAKPQESLAFAVTSISIGLIGAGDIQLVIVPQSLANRRRRAHCFGGQGISTDVFSL